MFERYELVTFAAAAADDAIHVRMVGKVVDVYGKPPEFDAVTAPETNAWATVRLEVLAAFCYRPRHEHLLSQRVAPHHAPLIATGYRLGANAPQLSATALRVVTAQLLTWPPR